MKKNHLFLSVIGAFMFLQTKAQIPQFEWAQQIEFPCYGKTIAIGTDNSQNVYTMFDIGCLLPIDFDPGVSVFNITPNTNGNTVFIQKLDANRNFLWAKALYSSDGGAYHHSVVDGNGNIYMTGGFVGTVDFDPGAGVVSLTAASQVDNFIAKYDSNGNLLWVKHGDYLSDSGIYCWKLDLARNGDIVVVGDFDGTIDIDPGVGVYNITSAGGGQAHGSFILKLDNNGNFIWAKVLSNLYSYRTIYGLAIDDNGNILTYGFYWNTMDFDPGNGTAYYNATTNGRTFIHKMDGNGNFIWVKTINSNMQWFKYNNIATDAAGSVYFSGEYTTADDFDPGAGVYNLTPNGGTDIFYLKLDNNGSFVWAKSIGGANNDKPQNLQIDPNGNIYSVGEFEDVVDFDPSASATFILSTSQSTNFSLFTEKLDNNGNFKWAQQIGDHMPSLVRDVVNHVDKSFNIYTNGAFDGNVDFDPNVGTHFMNSFYGFIFGQKLSQAQGPDGIEDALSENGIAVYPNPTNGELFVNTGDVIADEISVTNILGQVIYSVKPQIAKSQVLLADKAAGVYFVNVKKDGVIKSVKVLKQ